MNRRALLSGIAGALALAGSRFWSPYSEFGIDLAQEDDRSVLIVTTYTPSQAGIGGDFIGTVEHREVIGRGQRYETVAEWLEARGA